MRRQSGHGGAVLIVALVGLVLAACQAPAEAPRGTQAPPAEAPRGTQAPPPEAGRIAGTHGLPPAAVDAAPATPPAPVAHLRVPYSAIAGSTLVLPLARDAGLFARHGLDVEVVSIPGSSV